MVEIKKTLQQKNIIKKPMENKPQQKAQELLDKMNVIHYTKLASGNPLPVSMHDDQVKQCAINAVDEMINEYKQNSTFAQLEWVDYRIAFLEEVKMELEKS
jgi:hypothetical protein